ncbi:hypothetical protein FM038_006480 [Shewanella eurypsychrophilus]|uniref:Uncharacterized protein n=1 Tax=Shewanella eurypsychrophilus TaxID=2593656 RepID=A0ABX6V5M0_9GAMM|nr:MULTISPECIES: hypothetical protein [Shewanella]QFU21833.1 hypothetical protein FS418_08060 [Shewanella sp. YLB-09]QPG57122.1 hypothetical protein FM038_006480 [Shewanella eurypsychrophilus]
MKYSLLSAALVIGFVQTVSAHSSSAQSAPVHSEQAQKSLDIKQQTRLESSCSGVQPEQLNAVYEISQTNGSQQAKQKLELTRYQDNMVYQASPQSFEAWNKNGEYIRYFPMDKRSVSYRRSDLLSLNINYDLEQVFHLVSPKVQSQLKQTDNIQHGCMTVNSFNGEQSGQRINLQWVASLNLPYQLIIGEGEQTLRYQLIEVNPVTQAEFKTLTSGYKDIDFADVGDSESDPFIAKMITQGFIQHGSSGFYTSDGQQISGSGHGGHSH